MAALTTLKELRKMAPSDLLKEIRQQEGDVVKLRLGVKLGKEKDSAKYIRQKKHLSRMKTVYAEKGEEVAAEAAVKKPKAEPKKKPVEAKKPEVKKEEKKTEVKEEAPKPKKKSLFSRSK